MYSSEVVEVVVNQKLQTFKVMKSMEQDSTSWAGIVFGLSVSLPDSFVPVSFTLDPCVPDSCALDSCMSDHCVPDYCVPDSWKMPGFWF